ncbi:hypothetical protein RBSWK_06515 [Rhodopirellula baltica SWK14]|uniref:Uncharacterized protein n=1 Tax=Rhodopirellula baltica SWK14 TaxID=993516 RepID=L7C796_RHOBT|nr:hypothetical protein RBSWK_06515 [Rhodopirellula baltica SWK14]
MAGGLVASMKGCVAITPRFVSKHRLGRHVEHGLRGMTSGALFCP